MHCYVNCLCGTECFVVCSLARFYLEPRNLKEEPRTNCHTVLMNLT